MNTNNHNTTSTNTHNTHNPFTGDGVTNTHNPLTGDKTGPNPPSGTNPITGRTNDGNLGRHEQQPVGHTGMTGTHTGAHTGAHTGTHTGGAGLTSGTNTHNTHNPLTGDGVTNTHNPMTGDKTGPNPPSGTNPVTGRTNDGSLGRHEQQPAGYTGTTGTHTGAHTGTHTGTHTGGAGLTSGTNTHNTHNPLTGDGVTNTHNPMTGDKTGPNPPSGTNPVTGRTNDGNLGRHEQQPTGYTGTTGPTGTHTTGPTGTHTTGHTGTHTGAGITSGTNTHNTHNPLTGDGVTNTHNPMTGDKTGPNPPAGTNPVTGRTNDGNLGRHEQQPAGYTGTTGATGTDPHAIHDTTRGTHNTGAMGTTTGASGHPTSTQTSGGGAKALVGKVEATLGSIIKNPEMHAKGVQKQEEAQAAKAAKQEAAHGGAEVRH